MHSQLVHSPPRSPPHLAASSPRLSRGRCRAPTTSCGAWRRSRTPAASSPTTTTYAPTPSPPPLYPRRCGAHARLLLRHLGLPKNAKRKKSWRLTRRGGKTGIPGASPGRRRRRRRGRSAPRTAAPPSSASTPPAACAGPTPRRARAGGPSSASTNGLRVVFFLLFFVCPGPHTFPPARPRLRLGWF